MNFLQKTPFLRLLLPLIFGIVVGQYFVCPDGVLVSGSVLSILLVSLSFVFKHANLQYKFRWLFGSGIFSLMLVLGVLLTQQRHRDSEFMHLDQSGLFAVELIESPVEKANSYLCRVRTTHFYDSLNNEIPTKGLAIVYVQKDSLAAQLEWGDKLLLDVVFRQPDGAMNPEGFDYASYLKRQKVGATVYVPATRWRKVGSNGQISVFRKADQMQKKLMSIYSRYGIDGDNFAVLAALTLGSKDALHPELRQNYTTSGGMHILAVSGLHVGVIYLVISFLLKFLDRKRWLGFVKVVLILLFLWTYAFVTGLPPSVIRASLMFSLMAIGASLERKSQVYNTISMSAFFMLLINPDFLFDVGFQLSFSAVVSIVFFQPKISRWFYVKNRILRWSWELMAVSLAAQIGTAPFSLYYFHQFPNYFLLTNFVAIPLATLIIYTAVTLFVFSAVPYVGSIVAFILHLLLKALNISIDFIHQLPHALTISSISFAQLILLYACVVLFVAYWYTRKFISLAGALAMVMAIATIDLYQTYCTVNALQVIVFADNHHTHVNFIKGENHYLITTDHTSAQRAAGNFWLKRKLNSPLMLKDEEWFNNGFAEFGGKRWMVLTDNNLSRKVADNPIEVDYLVMGGGLKPRIAELMNCVRPKMIVVDKSISDWYTENIRQYCTQNDIVFYSVAENGACVIDFTD